MSTSNSHGAASVSVLELKNITLHYGRSVVAVDDVSLSLKQGEFLTLLGPSGSGKTSALRLIGGFEKPSRGEIFIAGENVTHHPPNARETATIFQSGALFPHKSVTDNIAYGLRMRKIPKDEIAKRVSDILDVVALRGFENRMPAEMSGGQRQRVALARSLVVRPRVLLFDEPLSALDLSLRVQLRAEIKRLHAELGFTAIFVTHDQSEAMSMSDRVAVMKAGAIVQIDTPETVYNHPASEFVYTFIGESCVLPLVLDGPQVTDTDHAPLEIKLGERPDKGTHRLYLRPNRIKLGDAAKACANQLVGQLSMVEFLGETRRYHIKTGNIAIICDSDAAVSTVVGDTITLGWSDSDARWFA